MTNTSHPDLADHFQGFAKDLYIDILSNTMQFTDDDLDIDMHIEQPVVEDFF
jgi:hypothetical protein